MNLKILVAEFFGTLFLILLGNGSVANVLLAKSKGRLGGWIVIATGWGLAVALGVYVCGWVSSGHINPAVTIAFATVGRTAWSLVPSYLIGQFSGAFVGAMLVYIVYHAHYQKEKSKDLKRMSFCTQPAIYKPIFNFITELIATFILLFAVLAVIDKHNSLTGGLAPYIIGVVVFSIGLSLGGPTGYAINPARDLSPRLAHSLIYSFKESQWFYAWIPLLAPLIGGVLGALCYKSIFG